MIDVSAAENLITQFQVPTLGLLLVFAWPCKRTRWLFILLLIFSIFDTLIAWSKPYSTDSAYLISAILCFIYIKLILKKDRISVRIYKRFNLNPPKELTTPHHLSRREALILSSMIALFFCNLIAYLETLLYIFYIIDKYPIIYYFMDPIAITINIIVYVSLMSIAIFKPNYIPQKSALS